MKYIKTYEYLNNYKVGDYVILKYSSHVFEIIKIEYKWSNPYFLEYYTNKLEHMNSRNEDIERLASPSEIEKYKLKKSIHKYNL